MVARSAQAFILTASGADINTAFCRTHDGISQVLRGTLVSVPEKQPARRKLAETCQERRGNCVFKEQKSGLGLVVRTAAAIQRSRAVFLVLMNKAG